MTGLKFGRLLVVERAEDKAFGSKKTKVVAWLCVCDCGMSKVITGTGIRSGDVRSCGCLKADVFYEKKQKNTVSKEYNIWNSMNQRCKNPSVKNYHRYGGRGIKVCERWRKFDNFIEDMGRRPTNLHSIERIDNDGDYCPENCKWATPKEQARNKSSSRIITYAGESLSLQEWAERIGITGYALSRRIKRNGIDAAMTEPIRITKLNMKFNYPESQK